MAKMVLGTLTFSRNPSEMTVIKKDRVTAVKETYSSVALFSWGSSIIGKTIELSWPFMTINDFTDLEALVDADEAVVFNPEDGSLKTYNVEIIGLDGKYHITPSVADDAGYRKDVRLTLLIMSEV